MAYDYIGICNDVLKALGEVEFANSTEFDAAVGLDAHVVDSVNYAITDLYNQEQNEWPFAKAVDTITLVAGTLEYSTISTAASIDWDSFFIQLDAALDLPDHRELEFVAYDKYKRYNRTSEENKATATEYTKPSAVVRTLDNNAIFYPKSDDVYTVEYEYFARPTTLSASTDVPALPEMYRNVLLTGVLVYMYGFLDDEQKLANANNTLKIKIDEMRRALIIQDDTMRSSGW